MTKPDGSGKVGPRPGRTGQHELSHTDSGSKKIQQNVAVEH